MTATAVSSSSDTRAAPGCLNMVDGTPLTAAVRSVILDCTGAGAVVFTFADGSTMTRNMQANTVYSYGGNIKQFHVTSGVATCDALL